eukprot:5636107-Prymnesium_polylepis.2
MTPLVISTAPLPPTLRGTQPRSLCQMCPTRALPPLDMVCASPPPKKNVNSAAQARAWTPAASRGRPCCLRHRPAAAAAGARGHAAAGAAAAAHAAGAARGAPARECPRRRQRPDAFLHARQRRDRTPKHPQPPSTPNSQTPSTHKHPQPPSSVGIQFFDAPHGTAGPAWVLCAPPA